MRLNPPQYSCALVQVATTFSEMSLGDLDEDTYALLLSHDIRIPLTLIDYARRFIAGMKIS